MAMENAAAVTINTRTSAAISETGEKDWYSVSLSGGMTYTFTLEAANATYGFNTSLSLFNSLTASDALMVNNDAFQANTNARITYTPVANETVYLGAAGEYGTIGDYVLSVSDSHVPRLNQLSLSQDYSNGAAIRLTGIDLYAYTGSEGTQLPTDPNVVDPSVNTNLWNYSFATLYNLDDPNASLVLQGRIFDWGDPAIQMYVVGSTPLELDSSYVVAIPAGSIVDENGLSNDYFESFLHTTNDTSPPHALVGGIATGTHEQGQGYNYLTGFSALEVATPGQTLIAQNAPDCLWVQFDEAVKWPAGGWNSQWSGAAYNDVIDGVYLEADGVPVYEFGTRYINDRSDYEVGNIDVDLQLGTGILSGNRDAIWLDLRLGFTAVWNGEQYVDRPLGYTLVEGVEYTLVFDIGAHDLLGNFNEHTPPFEFSFRIEEPIDTVLEETDYGFQVSADAAVTVSVDGEALSAGELASRFVVDTTSLPDLDVYTAKSNAFDGLETVSVDAKAPGMESVHLDIDASSPLDTSEVTLRVEGDRLYVSAGADFAVTVDGEQLSASEVEASFSQQTSYVRGQSINIYQPLAGAFDGSESIDVQATLVDGMAYTREVTGLQFDTTDDFLGDGIVQEALSDHKYWAQNSVAVDANGRIVVASTAGVWNEDYTWNNQDILLTRYTPDGALDSSFGDNGRSVVDLGSAEQVAAVAIDGEGRILVAGNTFANTDLYNINDIFVARFDVDGQLDTTFGADGSGFVVTDLGSDYENVVSVALAEDGGIVVAGTYYHNISGNPTDFMLVRYDDSGALDSNFGDGGVVITDLGAQEGLWSSALAAMEDGGWALVGNTLEYSDQIYVTELVAVRYDAVGSLDQEFGDNGIVVIDTGGLGVANPAIWGASAVVDGEGGIVFATNVSNFSAIGRLTPEGQLDEAFGTAGWAFSGQGVNNLMIDDQGQLFAAGVTNGLTPNGTGTFLTLTHFTADGQLDTNFGAAGLAQTLVGGWNNQWATDAALMPQGDIVVITNTHDSTTDRFGVPMESDSLVMVRYDSSGMLDTEPYVAPVTPTELMIDDVVSLASVVADPTFDPQVDVLEPQTGPLGFDTLDMSEVAVVGALDLNLGQVQVEVPVGDLGDTQVLSYNIGTGFDEYVLDGHGDGVAVFGRAEDSEMVSLVSAGNNYIDLNDASTDSIDGVNPVLSAMSDSAANLPDPVSGDASSPAPTVMDLRVTEMDIVNYGASEVGLQVDLSEASADAPEVQVAFTVPVAAPEIANDVLVHVEGILGSKADDVILGNALSNLLSGNAGNDRLEGGAGNDLLIGGAGSDTLRGGTGMDILVDLAGMNNVMVGGAGNDVFVTGDGLAAASLNAPEDGDVSLESTPETAQAQGTVVEDFALAQEFTSLPGRGDLAKDSVVFRVDLNRANLLGEYTASDIRANLHLELAAPAEDSQDRVLSLVFGKGENAQLLADITLAGVAEHLGDTYQLYAMFLDDTVSAGMGQGAIEHALGFEFMGDNVLTVRATVEQQRLGTLLDSRGDDVMLGGMNANVLVAGAGNDLLSGGRGADVYEYHVQRIDYLAGPKGHAAGYFGKDVITDWGNRSAADADVLYLEGVNSVEDLDFSRIQHAKEGLGGSLNIHVTQSAGDLTNTGDIVLFNQYSRTQTGYRVENLVLDQADGQRHVYDLGTVGTGKTAGGGDIISMDGQNNAILVGSVKADEFRLHYEGSGALDVYLASVGSNDKLTLNGVDINSLDNVAKTANNQLTITINDGANGAQGDTLNLIFLDTTHVDDYLLQHAA